MTTKTPPPARSKHNEPFAGTIDVKGREMHFFITDDAEFVAYPDRHPNDEPVRAPSKDALRKKLLRIMATASEDISIPIWLLRTDRIDRWSGRHGESPNTGVWKQARVRGVHGSNENALIEVDGERAQYAEYRHGDAFRGDMPESVRRRLIDLHKELVALYKEQTDIEDMYKVNPTNEARDALKQVVG